MKTLKSLLAALLVVVLACTMSVSTLAAYNDVDNANENLKAIEFVDRLGIIQSTWDGDFEPEQYLSRADAVKAVYRMLYGETIDVELYDSSQLEFNVSNEGDIPDDSTLAAYLQWAVDNYLVTTNVADAKFKPAEAITANELMTLIAKVLRLVDADGATYPDDYTEAVKELVGELEAGDTPVTREQAAVVFANALVAEEDGTPGEIGVYTDYDGVPLTSLAATALRMSAIDLVVRATVNRPLGFEVTNGTLLSNGMDVDLGEDLSDYVGYAITVTYCDADGSGTLTEDEKILTFSIGSASSSTVSFSEVAITAGNNITFNVGSQLTLSTSTYLYLNDAPWPIGDPNYDLTKFAKNLGSATSVTNRPNFKFKCMYTPEGTSLTAVFATESIPAKIVGINNGIYSIYDYYKAGTPDAIQHFSVTNCKFANTVKVGDYVNYYVSNGTCYFTPGTTIVSAFTARSATAGSPTDYELKNGTHLQEHAFFKFGSAPLKPDANEYVFITEDSGANLLITWENVQTNYEPLYINELSEKDNAYQIKATNAKTGAKKEFSVLFENVNSTTELAVGDYIDYADNGVDPNAEVAEGQTKKELITYVIKTAPATIEYIDMGNHIIDVATSKIYYKNQVCNKDAALTGNAVITLDMAETVVNIKNV